MVLQPGFISFATFAPGGPQYDIKNTQKSKVTKFGLRLNFENYNSSFALQAEKQLKD